MSLLLALDHSGKTRPADVIFPCPWTDVCRFRGSPRTPLADGLGECRPGHVSQRITDAALDLFRDRYGFRGWHGLIGEARTGAQVATGGDADGADAQANHPDRALTRPWPQMRQLEPQGLGMSEGVEGEVNDHPRGENRGRLGYRLDR